MGLFRVCAYHYSIKPIRTGAGPGFAPEILPMPSKGSTSADLYDANLPTAAHFCDQQEATGRASSHWEPSWL